VSRIKFSISNLAWQISDETDVIKVLEDSVFNGVEISILKYFDNIETIHKNQVIELRENWKSRSINITSLQSLLFNKPEFNIFDKLSESNIINYLNRIYEIAVILEIKPMVFGSPKNRLKGSMPNQEALQFAVGFFKKLTSQWSRVGPFLALEANPPLYGCDFVTDNAEAVNLVEMVGNSQFSWHLDYGCAKLAGEDPVNIIKSWEVLPSHVHLSEKNLGPLVKENFADYVTFLNELEKREYNGIVTLEMLPQSEFKSFYESVTLFNQVVKEAKLYDK
jgi:D-psicose/D-tagatose/L-ribulose 3-epimerase